VVISTFAKLLSRHIISFSILRTVGGFSAHDHIVGICRWCELLRVLPTRFVLLQFFNQPQKTSNKIFLLRSINNWTGAGSKDGCDATNNASIRLSAEFRASSNALSKAERDLWRLAMSQLTALLGYTGLDCQVL